MLKLPRPVAGISCKGMDEYDRNAARAAIINAKGWRAGQTLNTY